MIGEIYWYLTTKKHKKARTMYIIFSGILNTLRQYFSWCRFIAMLRFRKTSYSTLITLRRTGIHRRLLTHWGRDKMAPIFQTTFSIAFSWIKISLKFVSNGQINNIPALVQIMAWRRPGDKPLSEPRVVSLLTHICVTRPQSVKWILGNEAAYR